MALFSQPSNVQADACFFLFLPLLPQSRKSRIVMVLSRGNAWPGDCTWTPHCSIKSAATLSCTLPWEQFRPAMPFASPPRHLSFFSGGASHLNQSGSPILAASNDSEAFFRWPTRPRDSRSILAILPGVDPVAFLCVVLIAEAPPPAPSSDGATTRQRRRRRGPILLASNQGGRVFLVPVNCRGNVSLSTSPLGGRERQERWSPSPIRSQDMSNFRNLWA